MSTTPEPASTVVFDTTVLSNFALIACLPLLQKLYEGWACTTLPVVEEVRRGLTAGYGILRQVEQAFAPPIGIGWLEIVTLETPAEQACYLQLLDALDSGEAACLALAAHHGWVLASDDLAARRAAIRLNVRLTGTIGILVRLIHEGYLSLAEGNALLHQLLRVGYRSPIETLDELL